MPAPGILANDTGGSGPLTATQVTAPANGTLTFTNNGGFTYTASPGFTGTDSFTYRATDGLTTSSLATVTFTITNSPPTANNDTYTVAAGAVLTVTAPGILANDTGGNGPLRALLVSGASYGILNLSTNGGFSYQATNNYTGIDTFTYQATDGQTTSAVATVSISVLPLGLLFADNFNRTSLAPWFPVLGSWFLTNNTLVGNSANDSYGNAYVSNNWGDYLVQGQFQFSTTNAWGGGIGGRLADSANGQHYAAWIYPEGSGGASGGTAVMRLIKFHSWNETSGFTTLAALPLPNGVGTSWHTAGLAFQGSNIFCYFDNQQLTNVVDDGSFDGQGTYLGGGISADMYSDETPYIFSVSNVTVVALSANNNYSVNENATLSVGAPGVLGNDVDVFGSNLQATLLNQPLHGTLYLTNNGGFTYTPSNNYVGSDSFTYLPHDGANNLDPATVTITVVPVITVTVISTNRLTARPIRCSR